MNSVEILQTQRFISNIICRLDEDQGNLRGIEFWSDILAVIGICSCHNGFLDKAEYYFALQSVEILDYFMRDPAPHAMRLLSEANLPTHLYFMLYAEFMHFGARNLLMAKSLYCAALAINPYDASAWFMYGQLMKDLGRSDELVSKCKEKSMTLNSATYDECSRRYANTDVSDGITERQCFLCGKTGRFRKCGGCKTAFYCSKWCQRVHWLSHR